MVTWLREINIFFYLAQNIFKKDFQTDNFDFQNIFFVDDHSRANLSYKIWTVNEETK